MVRSLRNHLKSLKLVLVIWSRKVPYLRHCEFNKHWDIFQMNISLFHEVGVLQDFLC